MRVAVLHAGGPLETVSEGDLEGWREWHEGDADVVLRFGLTSRILCGVFLSPAVRVWKIWNWRKCSKRRSSSQIRRAGLSIIELHLTLVIGHNIQQLECKCMLISAVLPATASSWAVMMM